MADLIRRRSIGWLMTIVAIVAVACVLPTWYPPVWSLLDAPRKGKPFAHGVYAWFWIAILLSIVWRRRASNRLFDYGWIAMSVIALESHGPRPRVGTTTHFGLLAPVLLLVATLCFAGGLAARVKERRIENQK